MRPHYLPGQYLLVSPTAYLRRPAHRGDTVVVRHPSLEGRALLKRIIGLPGERVHLTEGRVLINGQPIEEPYLVREGGGNPLWDLEWMLGPDEYFVLGDNRTDSLDSRRLGPIKRGWIVGKAWVRLWPWSGWAG